MRADQPTWTNRPRPASGRRPARRPGGGARAARQGAGSVVLLALVVLVGVFAGGTRTGPTPSSTAPAPTATSPAALAPAVPSGAATAPAQGPSAPAAGSSAPTAGSGALAALGRLKVQDARSHAGYARDAFGYRAYDTDRNGCDTRNDVLRRDLTGVVLKGGTRGCVVLSGTLADPYGGTAIAFTRGVATSNDVQIDHVVSLADAWASGASAWTDDERHRFGNDPLELLAVSGPLNADKGDKTADAWLPPNVAYRCPYVARQVAVKLTYALTVTSHERAEMVAVLSSCPGQALPEGTAPPAGAGDGP